MTDFVSFPLRAVIDLVPSRESEAAARSRNDRRRWLQERGYRVLAIDPSDVESDLTPVLDRLARQITGTDGEDNRQVQDQPESPDDHQ